MKRTTFILFWLILLAGWTVGTFGQERPGGVSSNSVYNIALVAANSVGGPTNGVTAATAASIAATNVSRGWAYGATNLAPNSNITNVTKYINSTWREPYWTVSTFGDGYLFKQLSPQGHAFMSIRTNTPPNRALYIGDVDNNDQFDAVATFAGSTATGNTDPRITWVFSGDDGVYQDMSWQVHERSFGADYVDSFDTFNHVRLDFITYNPTNRLTELGYTNYQTAIVGTNVFVQAPFLVTTNSNPQIGTLYTNGNSRARFYASISISGGGENNIIEGVTYRQGGSDTQHWSQVQFDDSGSIFNGQTFNLNFPVNPSAVYYLTILSGSAGNFTVITNNWKLVSE